MLFTTVKDQGEGMSEEKVAALFKPMLLRELTGDRSASSGIGLGLGNSLALARALGGDVTIDS